MNFFKLLDNDNYLVEHHLVLSTHPCPNTHFIHKFFFLLIGSRRIEANDDYGYLEHTLWIINQDKLRADRTVGVSKHYFTL